MTNNPPVKLDSPIARGRTADVFEWDEGFVLKLFHPWFALEDIEYELRIARAVHASGVKSPALKELVQVQGRNGLVYERVAGKSMLQVFQQRPWQVVQLGKTLATLHTQMHACVFEADVVPMQKTRIQHKLKSAEALPVYLKPKLLNALEAMPEGDRVCHGDFHPANVLINGNAATVIDWIDTSRGNPLADVARTSIILLGATASSQIPNSVLKIIVRLFHATYLNHYFRLHPQGRAEYRHWLPIVAGARLSEGIPELETWLVEQAGKQIGN